MKQFFGHIYTFFERKPILFWLTLILTVIGLSLCTLRLHFVEDIGSFLPNSPENEQINYAYKHLGAANKIMVMVADTAATPDLELTTAAVDTLVEYMERFRTDGHFTEITYQVNQQMMADVSRFMAANLFRYLDTADYARLDTLLTPSYITQQIAINRELAASPAGGLLKATISTDPLHLSTPLLRQLESLQTNDQPQSYNGYLLNKAGNEAMVAITSTYPVSETAQNTLLVEQINQAVAHTRQAFGNRLNINSIGASIISIGNAQQIKRDTWISTTLALILILALLLYFFRDVRALLTMLFAIAFGGLCSLAFLAIFKNQVSVIAVGAGSIIVGLAANYPLHFLAHIQQGYTREQTIGDITAPLLTGNITTVGAFLSLLFISSDAMHDLGLFSALLLIGTIFFVLIFLPHLFRRKMFAHRQNHENKRPFGRAAGFAPEKHKWLVWLAILLTMPLYWFSRQTGFETDMNAINYMTDEQRTAMNKLINETENTGTSTLYCVATGNNEQASLQAHEQLRSVFDSLTANGLVTRTSGIGQLLPSEALQQKRCRQWQQFCQQHGPALLAQLDAAATQSGFRPEAFEPFRQMVLGADSIRPIPLDEFSPAIMGIAENYLSTDTAKCLVYNMLQVPPKHIDSVRHILANNSNCFCFDNRSMVSKMVDGLSDDFNYVLYICSFIVLLFLTLSFGRIELSLVSFLPLTIGWIWILGIMGILDMHFNIVNIILATFIFGQGDDYTIFVTEGLMYEYARGKKMLETYKNAVLLSSSIMFIGIGALIVAKHPAMRSLAEVTMVGMLSVIAMVYLLPPLIFGWLTTHKGRKRIMPITLISWLKTGFSFIVFCLCALLMTLLGFGLLTLGGKTDRHKAIFHKCLCGMFRLLVRLMPNVTYQTNNQQNDLFDKPHVLICNHQSHLDLLYTLALSPKIICLTKNWVWNNPFYGWIIRYADFLPVDNGLDANIASLRKMVDKGYSILVFPEGTRSENCAVQRFHQGAFHMARQLGLDVQPLLLHGTGHVLPKTEFILRKGHVTLQMLERIAVDNDTPLKILTRQMQTMYEQQYAQLASQQETPSYFADLVRHNYLYKGKDIASEAKRALADKQHLEQFVKALPDTGEVHIANCGIGAETLLAALVKKQLTIVATDPDADKVDIARNCAAIPHNLKYE